MTMPTQHLLAAVLTLIAPPAGCQDGWAAFGEHCYLFSYETETYSSARSKCQTIGGDLVSIHSPTENIFLFSLLGPDDPIGTWIGMSDEGHPGSFSWSDGTATTFTSWENDTTITFTSWETLNSYRARTEPSCGGFSHGASSRAARWSLHECHTHMHYLCKKLQRALDTPKEGCAQCSSRRERSSGLKLTHESPAPSFSSPFRSRFSTPFKRDRSQHYEHTDNQLNVLHSLLGNIHGQSPRLFPKISLSHRFRDHKQDHNGTPAFQPQVNIPQHLPPQSLGTLLHYQPSEAAQQKSNMARGNMTQNTTTSLAANSSESLPVSSTTDSSFSTTVDRMGQGTLPPTLPPEAGQETMAPMLPPEADQETMAPSLPPEADQKTMVPTLPPEARTCEMGDMAFNGSCYSFSADPLTWAEAQADCETRSAHLIVLNDRFESAFISPLLRFQGYRTWIGLADTTYDHNSDVVFSWVNSEPVGFTNWDKFGPALRHGTCVSASGTKFNLGQWAVADCLIELKYICEYDVTPTTSTTVNCAEGWYYAGDRCLQLFLKPKTWSKAKQTCVGKGGYLASLSDSSQQVMRALPGFTHVIGRNSSVWIELKLNPSTDYEWRDDPFLHYRRYFDIADELLIHGRKICTSMDVMSLKFSHSFCNEELPYVCEAKAGGTVTSAVPPSQAPDVMCVDEPSWYLFESYCYKFISSSEDPQTWWESHRRCRDEQAELASIHSSKENNWIISKIFHLSDPLLWVGGRAELDHGYEWIDQTPFNFVKWATGEPNNFLSQEDCITLYNHQEGNWNDQNCGQNFGRVCKRQHGATPLPALTTEVPDGHCPSAWTHVGAKCIQLFTDKKNFTAARTSCWEMGADLASIHSAQEQAYLTAVLGPMGVNLWVGLRNIQGFQWVDQTAFTYSNWGPMEPNGAKMLLRAGNKPEDCVELLRHNRAGQWNDVYCDKEIGYVCQRTVDPNMSNSSPAPACEPPFGNYIRFNDACYRPDSNAKTWQEAEATCVDEGGHLASVHDLSENAKMWILIQESGFKDAWIGLRNLQDGLVFKWSDGWPRFYSNWDHKEPNGIFSNHSCTRMRTVNGLWSSVSCNETSPFICKFKSGPVPTLDPPSTGYCPDSRWLDLGGGYCYLISKQAKPWKDANMKCIQEHANLVSVHSELEMSLLTKATHHITDALWIGLIKKRAGYGWSDDTALDFINWKDGEPNNKNEQCTEASSANGQWNDVTCSVVQEFICKTLKIQSVVSTMPSLPTDPAGTTHHLSGWTSEPQSAGSIIGIIIAILILAAGVGYVRYSYARKKPKPARDCGNHGFDNALYSGDDAIRVQTRGVTVATINLESSCSDTIV